MPRILRTRESDQDLLEIAAYIARDNPRAADALIDKIDQKLQLLAQFAGLGPQRPEFGEELRSFPIGN